MTRRDLLTLVSLAALWGGSFLFIRIASPVVGPFVLALGRILIGGGVLWIGLRMRGQRAALRAHLPRLLLLGLLNASLPYALISAAELRLTASLTAMLNATIPTMSALLSVSMLGERLTTRRSIALLVGTSGVACIVGWTPFAMTRVTMICIGAVLVACVSYAAATVYAKRAFVGVSSPTLALGQQVGAAPWLLVPAVWELPHAHVTAAALLAVLALGVLSTAVAYLLYFRLIINVGATTTASVAYLFPAFGAVWGALFLREHITLGMMGGFALIGASMMIANARYRFSSISAITFPSLSRNSHSQSS